MRECVTEYKYRNYCTLYFAIYTASSILAEMHKHYKRSLIAVIIFFACIGCFFTLGYLATYFHLTETEGVIDTQTQKFVVVKDDIYTPFPLAHTSEWIAFRKAIAKDAKVIRSVSQVTGIPERLLVAIAVPEQMRLYHSDRALFKKVFEPLKILGDQSQFSWGIFGIKDETARAVEQYLKNPLSPYYAGKKYENLLSFASDDVDQERFARITSTKDHTYTYLYTALYVKEIEAQWNKKGYSITNRPEIVATLWNLGFAKSVPNKDPKSGGSVLDINGKKHSFGSLAYDFYYSDEMIELFPRSN